MPRTSYPLLLSAVSVLGASGVIADVALISGGMVCPLPWMEAEGRCFRVFGAAAADRKTWNEGEVMCQLHGAHLATVTSQAQSEVIASLLEATTTKKCANGGPSFCNPRERLAWIGLADAARAVRTVPPADARGFNCETAFTCICLPW